MVPPDSDNPRDENESNDDNDDDSIMPMHVNRSNGTGERLTDDDDDEEDVGPEALVDVDPAIVERESKILRAAKHVIMARAQRKLFQQATKKAREDTTASSNDTNDVLVLQQSKR